MTRGQRGQRPPKRAARPTPRPGGTSAAVGAGGGDADRPRSRPSAGLDWRWPALAAGAGLVLLLAWVQFGSAVREAVSPRPTPAVATLATPPAPPPPAAASPSVRFFSPAAARSIRRTFEEATAPVPAGWTVRAEPGAPSASNALCQQGDAPALLLLGDASPPGDADRFLDGRVSALLEPAAAGAAGVVLRAQSDRTYYLARADAARGSVEAVRVLDGAETSLGRAGASVQAGRWQELRASMSDNTLFVWLDNRQVLSAADDAITAPGLAGIWAAAGSGACFDDVAAEWRRQ